MTLADELVADSKSYLVKNGHHLQAPLFIKTGEKIKVDTRTGKYMERP